MQYGVKILVWNWFWIFQFKGIFRFLYILVWVATIRSDKKADTMSLRLLDGLLSLSNHKTGALEGHSFKRNLILPLRLRSRRRRGRGQVSTLASLSTSASASASASPSLGDLMRLDFPILNQVTWHDYFTKFLVTLSSSSFLVSKRQNVFNSQI